MKQYFPHDCNARSDEKIVQLRIKHGWAGYGIYWALIEKLRDENEYMLTPDYDVLAYDLRCDASLVKSIIIDFGLFSFTDDRSLFFSPSLSRRMGPLDKKIERAKNAAKIRWSGKGNHANTMQMHNDSNANAMQMHDVSDADKNRIDKNRIKDKPKGRNKDAAKAATLKRKEEFGKSLIPFIEKYSKEMIRSFFDYWSELNKSETKMRFEKQPTWEVSKRLATWANKEKFNGNKKNTSITQSGNFNSGEKPGDQSNTETTGLKELINSVRIG